MPLSNKQQNLLTKIQSIKTKQVALHQQTIEQQKQVQQLKQAILQEAIQGKLTADWRVANPDVEPASELLKRIKLEKEQLIKDRKVRAGKKQKSNDLGNIQFKLPKKWLYVDLDYISQFITDGTHQTPTYTEKGKIFLSAQNVKPFKFIPENYKFVSQKTFDKITKGKEVERGDLLVGRVGSKGETAVIDQEIEFAFYVSLGFIKTFKNHTSSEYLAIVMNSPYGNISSKPKVF